MRSPAARRWQSASLLVLQAAALALGIALWWSERHNTLFHGNRWVAGKDTGKFVFYTNKFLLRPLERGEVDLTSDMGFQEILHREPEGPRRRLESLALECLVAPEAYLWIRTRKVGPRAFAARISRNPDYPGGFHRFGPEGELEGRAPFDGEPAWAGKGRWNRVELRLESGAWRLRMNGRELGSAPEEAPPEGAFGFQGSGKPGAPVLVRDIVLRFQDPVSGRTWSERERFSAVAGLRRAFPLAGAFALALLLLRRWRRRLLGALLRPADRARLLAADEVAVSCATALAAAAGLLRPTLWAAVPAALLAAEIVFVVTLALGAREDVPAAPPRGRWELVLLAVVLSAVGAAALARHGDMVGRGTRDSSWWNMRNVHPDSYRLRPAEQRSSPAYASSGTFPVSPNLPFFPEGRVWRGQRITLDFVPAATATLDVVFQQLSFVTHGDPDGEELPLQRRLLRLAAREDVPAGLATGTNRQPSPFLKLEGRPGAGTANHLEIESGDGGVAVTLNGRRSFFPGAKPLGYGETGLLAYDGAVAVTSFRVDPPRAELARGWLLPLAGLLLPVAAAALVWLVLRCGGPVPPGEVAAFVLGGLLLPAGYLAGVLLLDRNTLLVLARERLGWLEISLVAASVFLPALVLRVRGRLKGAVGFFYLACFALIAAVALLAIDALAQARPELFRRFARDEAVLPGDLAQEDGGGGPWYTHNRVIGANNYVWRQRFGTRQAGEKPPGTTRVFLMGGSQAWGSGAADSSSTFDQLVGKRLRARGLQVEVFNAGINGAGVRGIGAFFEGVIARLAPDIVILDIGLNDSAGISMAGDAGKRRSPREAALREFQRQLDRCAAAGADVLLVLEPMCGETPLRPDAEYYAGLERIARSRGVRVLAPQETLRAAERDQSLWWDTAHLAPAGHELMSRLLEPVVAEMIAGRAASAAQGGGAP